MRINHTEFENVEENELPCSICKKKTVSSISESIDKKEFRRNWRGPSCETKTGKCEFYQICKKLEEDTQNGKQRKNRKTKSITKQIIPI